MKKLKDITGTYLWEYAEDDDEGKAFVILTGLGRLGGRIRKQIFADRRICTK